MRRDEIWWANLPSPWGTRPVLLLHRDPAYTVLPWILVAPLTTTIRRLPSGVILTPATDGVVKRSLVNLDSILLIHVDWLAGRITQLGAERMREVDRAIHFALALSD